MREGDIYRWEYPEEAEKERGFGAYHCKSRIAVFEGGRLYDTFWSSSPTAGSFLDPEKVELTLVGNRNDLEVFSDREDYYHPDDLIIMRHANDTRAETLVKPGAKRDPDKMREVLREKQDEARREIQSATRDLERLAVAEKQLEDGDYDKLYF